MAHERVPEVSERICLEASEAHDAHLQAVHALEISLAEPIGENPEGWRARVVGELDALLDCLKQHCSQSEVFGGSINEMEVTQGRSAYVTEVEHAHNEVLAAAQALRTELAISTHPHAPYSKLRREAAHFTAALRNHQAREIDMIYETFWRDSVGGD